MRESLAIFPLGTVLYPDSRLPLRIFEPRYVAMLQACLRNERGFGVCLILDGREAGDVAVPHAYGCEARIVECETLPGGQYNLLTRGARPFRLLSRRVDAQGLAHGEVEWRALPSPVPVPASAAVAPLLLQRLIDEIGVAVLPQPHRLDDAAWVAHRLAELLPFALPAKQNILESGDPLDKLDIVMRQLRRMDLIE